MRAPPPAPSFVLSCNPLCIITAGENKCCDIRLFNPLSSEKCILSRSNLLSLPVCPYCSSSAEPRNYSPVYSSVFIFLFSFCKFAVLCIYFLSLGYVETNYKLQTALQYIRHTLLFSCIVYSVPGHKPQRVGALEGLHLGLECQSGDQQVGVCVPAQPENMKKILPHKDCCNKGRPGEQPGLPHPDCHQGVLQQISRLLHFSYMKDLKI